MSGSSCGPGSPLLVMLRLHRVPHRLSQQQSPRFQVCSSHSWQGHLCWGLVATLPRPRFLGTADNSMPAMHCQPSVMLQSSVPVARVLAQAVHHQEPAQGPLSHGPCKHAHARMLQDSQPLLQTQVEQPQTEKWQLLLGRLGCRLSAGWLLHRLLQLRLAARKPASRA